MDKIAYYAQTLSDAFYYFQNVSSIQVVAGGTASCMPQNALCIRKIPELLSIDKHERHIDIGSAVTLSRLLSVRKVLPDCLVQALNKIANVFVRNIATVGGNICATDYYHALYAPLFALDARLEMRKSQDTRYIHLDKLRDFAKNYILTKVRIPLDDWKISVYRLIENDDSDIPSSFVFLADMNNDTLRNIRLSLAGRIAMRCRELENNLAGIRLPLRDEAIQDYVKQASSLFDKSMANTKKSDALSRDFAITKEKFLRLTRYSLQQLS